MDQGVRRYRYVGPADLRAAVRPGGTGRPIRDAADLAAWAEEQTAADLAEPFTYVVDVAGVLRLAPRRSEHVACADGGEVLGAGEIALRETSGTWAAAEVSNLSTGYCPDTPSWSSVARALDRAGLGRPSGFTHAVVFRRCTGCGERGIVREDDFVCVFCGSALPGEWNVDPSHGDGAPSPPS
ncbi:hypothetical protein ACIP98_06795 [Streptomyces sp. NPDC088354]|uniref:hypothetical protein n=1 Tax=unclassified Streptomyces TaxID=2593676 RepID=UPI0029B1A11F|nr:hypothetical protein [Streptomyces sp. MI02-7b]MDX3071572.1 hypothetical protein [Streptomyces sp. MI02-7b]